MRRVPRIINLYDKPAYPRLALARRTDTLGLGTALLSCAAITLATAGFFWGYDAIAHRDGLYVPTSVRAATSERRPVQTSGALALAPDMNAPAVVHANADVPATQFQKNVARTTEHSPVESSAAAPPKKKAHAVRRISSEARESYASLPAFSRSATFGGW